MRSEPMQPLWLIAGLAILTDHLELDVAPEVVAADLEEGYRATLWERGGS